MTDGRMAKAIVLLVILWALSAVSQCGYPTIETDCDPNHPGSYWADNGWGKVMCVWPE